MKQVLALLFLAAASAAAQTASIDDTLTAAAGGGAWTGKITVALNNPGAAQPLYSGTTSLAGWSRTLCLGVTGSDCSAELSAGVVTITLYANDSITPAGTSYAARFVPTRGSAWVETWTVEAADTKLYQIRSTTTPTPTTTFQPGQIVLSAGRLLYGSSLGVGTSLAVGTNGHYLTLSGGYPAWAALSVPNQTPASSSASCTAGTMVWDESYLYVCVSTNTWKRKQLDSF